MINNSKYLPTEKNWIHMFKHFHNAIVGSLALIKKFTQIFIFSTRAFQSMAESIEIKI